MDLVLAMDLKGGAVVHGKGGDRDHYEPLTWGLSSSADPELYLRELRPRFLYIADLDRISHTGSHNAAIVSCARMVERCYVDRGCRSPRDLFPGDSVVNVVGTETAGDLSRYKGGMLSIDVRDGRVLPDRRDVIAVLHDAERLGFDCCLVLDISAVGTEGGLSLARLEMLRDAYQKPLFYGGGVRDTADLARLATAGFDGAVVATAVHTGAVPVGLLRKGSWCS